MERGVGKHWTEEETKAFLSVWAERNIGKQRFASLRNKGVFVYIAEGCNHYEYTETGNSVEQSIKSSRIVKDAHSSGDSARTMKFFHDLDAV